MNKLLAALLSGFFATAVLAQAPTPTPMKKAEAKAEVTTANADAKEMKAVVKADAKFVADVKSRTSGLEAQWIKDAEAKGLPNAAKVLAEFRSEIAKQEK